MRKETANRMSGPGFTLIEMLVVIAIITILTGMLVPTIGRAREAAKQAVCGMNLRQIGYGIQSYMQSYNDYYPPMAPLPTAEPVLHPVNPRPAMNEVLAIHVGRQLDVFHCPSDRIRDRQMLKDPTRPQQMQTYFDWQGSSYEPRTGLSVVDKDGFWRLSREGGDDEIMELFGSASRIVLLQEYEAFHSLRGNQANEWNALFADFHAGTIEDIK